MPDVELERREESANERGGATRGGSGALGAFLRGSGKCNYNLATNPKLGKDDEGDPQVGETEDVDGDRAFKDLGFDSLMTLDLRNRLESSLGLSLSATLVWNYPTITDLTDHLAERLGITLVSPAGLPTLLENDSYPSHALAEIQQLSDAEAEAALAAKLSAIEEGKKR